MEFIDNRKEEADNPQWVNIPKYGLMVHDWRTYVTRELKDNWFSLSLETRCAIVDVCQEVADNEHWD